MAGELACVIIDELHMVSDASRGKVLELCLTKLLAAPEASQMQIIGMSATMAGMPRHGISALMADADAAFHARMTWYTRSEPYFHGQRVDWMGSLVRWITKLSKIHKSQNLNQLNATHA